MKMNNSNKFASFYGILPHYTPFFDPLDSMHAYARTKKDNFSFSIMVVINYEKREEIVSGQ
jgi:hypothetical protein